MAISIIIPSTGERVGILIETISAALAALHEIDGEIIVIKNEAKTINITHPKLKVVNVDFNNVSASRNKGAAVAAYDLLCFIDDDMLVSGDNMHRFINFAVQHATPYLLTAVWVHSSRVNALKETTLLGQMLALHLPNDSFKTRYNNVSKTAEWQDDRRFKSSMKTTFWEACFSMRRNDYLRVGGMNEFFDFGNEGTEFLKRALEGGLEYYVDPTNVIVHNEWDKFNDWSIPEKRWRTEARLVNDGKISISYPAKMYLHKVIYGVLIYAFRIPLRAVLRNAPANNKHAHLYFKLFDIYSTSIYWHQIAWSVIGKS